MSSFKLHIHHAADVDDLNEEFGIFLYRATRIPPHLGWFINGKIYDITTNGPTIGVELDAFVPTLLKRKTEAIFISFKDHKFNDILSLEQEIKNAVQMHYAVDEDKSCMAPIFDVLKLQTNLPINDVQFFFELYPVLVEKNMISVVSHINLEKKIDNQEIEMKKYTQEDIKECIAAMDRKIAFA